MTDLTFQDILNILRLIDSGPFSDFQVEFEGTKLKVTRRTGATLAAGQSSTTPAPAVTRSAEPAKTAVAPSHDSSPKVADKLTVVPNTSAQRSSAEVSNGIEVKPPMAGMFYSAPSPGAAPFVEVDRKVRKGDQLGIVEVMKLFTAVIAPCDGIVRSILIGNEQFVESDQTLMIIAAAES